MIADPTRIEGAITQLVRFAVVALKTGSLGGGTRRKLASLVADAGATLAERVQQ